MHLEARDDRTFDLRVGRVERQLLTDLCGQLRAMLVEQADDPALRRLFPPAYADDAERDAFYRQMTHDELVAGRVAALDTIIRTVDAETLTLEDLEAWMAGINALRLTLGTRLDVSEDDEPFDDADEIDSDDPRLAARVAYDYLAHVLALLVHVALRG